ncbi:MAG TPA: ABC transporter substrate-binding protein [Xanthobacteraceae bacterium]|jgi:4,5-dihydroxyphthalate decarboxylase
MSSVPITVACGLYDRTLPIRDGRIPIEGCDINFIPMEPEEVFFRSLRYEEFDVSELSFSSYLMLTSRGECPYIAVPAFVSRVFRHAAIYIRTDRGIRRPEDLKGRLVGVPEYQITAAVWARGMLEEEYGVKPSDIRWRTGGLEETGRDERTPLTLDNGVEVKPIGEHQTLCAMLDAGEIDALITARNPSSYLRRVPNVDRLFPDYPEVEQAYFRKTGLFPIMHIIGVRKTLADRYPWLAASVYKAFSLARDFAAKDLAQRGQLRVIMPWVERDVDRVRAVMGDNYWPYGVKENIKSIEAILRYAWTQGLLARRLTPEEIFARSTIEVSRL